MQFVHISDNHLGYRQYNLDEREQDFYGAFMQCIDKIIEIRPDFVVHSGDLFERSAPPINAIHTAIEGFCKLKEHNIPIFMIHGNHDFPKRDTRGSPFKILKSFLGNNLKTFVGKKHHVFSKGCKEVFIGGSDHTDKNGINELFENYKLIENESKNYKHKILLFHQSIYSYSNMYDYELQMNNFPKGFTYYAGGHIHQRILKTVNNDNDNRSKDCTKSNDSNNQATNSVLAYSGSTEICKYDEYRDYEQNGKGFYLVDIGGDFDITCVDKIDIKCRDFVIDKRIESKADLDTIFEEINSKSKPVVVCSVVKEFLEHLNEFLRKKALYSKISIIEDEVDEILLNIQNENMDDLFIEFLKSKNYDVSFVYGIYNEASSGDLYNYIITHFKQCYGAGNK
jgi:DNA repair exonuclease SbcCD nuclease subunit